MVSLQNISYLHPDRELLFDHITLSVNPKEKVAIIGNNGTGKSTLLKIISGQLHCASGTVSVMSQPYYVPQIVGQFDNLTVAQALGIEKKLNALSEILSGTVTEDNLAVLNDDWAIEDRLREAFAYWNLSNMDSSVGMSTLSGGEKTKVFLAGIMILQPQIVLLDEPTNHLDSNTRELLYRFIEKSSCTMAIVSHDRMLLNRLDKMYELNPHGIKVYGGNYNFYKEQKEAEQAALADDLEEKQKSLRKAKQVEREAAERQRKRESQGAKNTAKGGLPKILAGGRKNNAENSTARLSGVHADKVSALSQELKTLRERVPDRDKIKFGIDSSVLHRGKILVTACQINFAYAGQNLWKHPLDFQIVSGERIVIKGDNGSGKTTLLKLILGKLHPSVGEIVRADSKTVYIDQDYSPLNDDLSVYEQAQTFNDRTLPEHEIKTRLNRFLFTKDFWNKSCAVLSGGEKMRLLLCCLTLSEQSPDIIILDEPTNNIDIQNIEILTAALNEYKGTIIVVSHDLLFLEQIEVWREIIL